MEPGKIPHEIRHGELAAAGILPFQPYYGTHDATSLFLIVLSYLYQWRGDVALLERYLPNAEAAHALDRPVGRSRWRRVPGVRDPLVARLLQPGLEGRRRRDPARRRLAGAAAARACASSRATPTTPSVRLADDLRRPRPTRTTPSGSGPRRRGSTSWSTSAFWWEEEGTYYLASTATSSRSGASPPTPATCWPSGIVPPRARGAGGRSGCWRDDMWSGWGIRTLSSDHPGVQPVQLPHGHRSGRTTTR